MENRKKTRVLTVIAVALAVILAVLAVIALTMPKPDKNPEATTQLTTEPTTQATTEPTTEPTEPPIQKIATATISTTGDILMHQRVIDGGYDAATKTYNYDNIFTYFAKYVQEADLAAANMEGTLCANEGGRKYTGYPRFNVPDSIVDATKKAGFDVLLTANNHAYDTKSTGFRRTPVVIEEKGLLPLGSVTSVEKPNYAVQDVNGIKVGMVCYTYETVKQKGADKSLNAIALDNADAPLINTFNYSYLDEFYERVKTQMEAMKQAGAEATVMFIHWGTEYKTAPNSWQKKIGQALCDLGVDVIVGGHAHVVQPVTVFTSQADPEHTTLCLYSLGNAVSNIRYSSTRPAETEDGMLFSFTLAKYSDGSVVIQEADILSTWVNRYTSKETGREVFAIIPLDTAVEDWKTAFDLTDSTLKQAQASLGRSQKILAEGLEEANRFYAEKQAQLETELGIVKAP